ncbi:Putative two-domain glycosyltransferase [Arcticibacter svalbardensis MN12-7]|uniref:Putative two-domain glycosyltransferase n=1 Tax=Arcticibacter svalbardensis MN12-7 TaxID=1150600 RepID=R9GYC6_9SPHI|nr:glycosyltransferase family 2 protein [Arcticibacter svalbardensis]EOR93989.1 Putative two-domain glycosyltransferase [Arcticibacter svalbardensis MN12-7]
MANNIKTSLIISTYNWPEALSLCLLSVSKQSIMPDEVIIADDGSTWETLALVEKYIKDFPVPLRYVWQEDEGFQLAKIRNKAIAQAQHEYIIQIDGDLTLHKHFIKDHIELSQKGAFITGSRVLMDKSRTEVVMKNNQTQTGLLLPGLKNHTNRMRIKFLRDYFADRYKQGDNLYLRGCNMAFWKSDLIKVNGYNEDFCGWGKEDNEIAVRLINSGIKKRAIKFGGVVFHMYHGNHCLVRNHENEHRLAHAIKDKITYCSRGISQYYQFAPQPQMSI